MKPQIGLRSLKSLAMIVRRIQKQNFVLTTFGYLVIFFTTFGWSI